ncbi:hypothetical protein GPA19_19545 [Azoarcus indigens]|uniref:hypothetical protein n=1 Tax=Azoarcus indigens TaxID=29545 RepID=UPI00105E7CB6|nr:hypothetical protein [Azoarcus indigens]NMG67139.1 hypothetical protein [Azoarcus indigens]
MSIPFSEVVRQDFRKGRASALSATIPLKIKKYLNFIKRNLSARPQLFMCDSKQVAVDKPPGARALRAASREPGRQRGFAPAPARA